jgi:serine/threonine protein kinase
MINLASESNTPTNTETTSRSVIVPVEMSSQLSKAKFVSFREDVFLSDQNGLSARSGMSDSVSNSVSSSVKYSKLRSGLTRERTNRDPFYFYQVTRNLGSGSMGDVKLVKKRADKIGGSARRDVQQAFMREKQEKECFRLPVIGNLFQFCLDGDEEPASASSSRHSFTSLGGKDDVTVTSSRSFEDSLLADDSPEIIYAMKSILLSQVTQKEFIDELRNEIAILKELDHPNIVRAIETFEFHGKIFVVMEVCSGGDLYARDPYTEAEAARIVSSILSAIAYMHSRNVVHRDLKFENVLFNNASPMSDVKLIDFGLSKVYAGGRKLTDVSGTIYTMAPEVLMGHHTEKADMWSIGKSIFLSVSQGELVSHNC